MTVESDSVWQIEAPRLCAFAANTAQVLAIVCELLNTIIGGTDPNPVVPVNTQ